MAIHSGLYNNLNTKHEFDTVVYLSHIFQLGSLLPITTPAPPTTAPPPANPPFEASNLINQIPVKADGTGVSYFYLIYFIAKFT